MKNKILIIGFGESGKWAYNLGIKKGYMPLIYDDKFMTLECVNNIWDNIAFAVISPGVKKSHPLVEELNKKNIKILSEIEFAYKFRAKSSKIVGVTGTNGKTTVVRLIESVLGQDCVLGGNIGVPYSKIVTDNAKVSVLELSSFQLERINRFAPHIAVITNLAPDHIDYHGTFENYINAKLNIVKNKTTLIYCAEDELLTNKVVNYNKKFYYSLKKRDGNGIYISGGWVKVEVDGIEELLFQEKEIAGFQKHNKLNILACSLVCFMFGKTGAEILLGVKNFVPSPYREQVVKNKLGIIIVNDSKSTNLASTLTAIENYKDKNICLIVGGRPKNEDYSKLFKQGVRFVKIIAYGESANEFLMCANKIGYKKLVVVETLKESVEMALQAIKKGDVLLFSPACASFDQFSSYEERGSVFDELIRRHQKLI